MVLNLLMRLNINAAEAHLEEQLERIAERYFGEVDALSDEEIPAAGTKEHERFVTVMLKTYRRAVDTLDPDLAPLFGRLVRAHVREEIATVEFRAIGRLLESIDSDDVDALSTLLCALVAHSGPGSVDDDIYFDIGGDELAIARREHWMLRHVQHARLQGGDELRRVARALTREDIAERFIASGELAIQVEQGAPNAWYMSARTVSVLATIVGIGVVDTRRGR